MRKPKKKIIFKCSVCGEVAEPSEKKGMWEVYPTKCVKCGGDLKPSLE